MLRDLESSPGFSESQLGHKELGEMTGNHLSGWSPWSGGEGLPSTKTCCGYHSLITSSPGIKNIIRRK